MFMDEIGLIFVLCQPSQVLVLRWYWLHKHTEMQLVFLLFKRFCEINITFSFLHLVIFMKFLFWWMFKMLIKSKITEWEGKASGLKAILSFHWDTWVERKRI